MKWEQIDRDDSRVTEYSEIIHKRYFEKLTNRPSVLILLDSNNNVQHIEKVNLGEVTISIAKHILGEMNYAFSNIKVLYTKNQKDAESLADHLLEKYNPHKNK